MATMFPGAPADVHVDGGGSAKEPLPLLLVVLGPTGSGKTTLSLVLGEHFDGEIVNCDSVALYREFEIGTAKPSPEERTRVPHHLFDRASPTQEITAGEYARIARGTLRQISARKRLPIVVGGTGLYFRRAGPVRRFAHAAAPTRGQKRSGTFAQLAAPAGCCGGDENSCQRHSQIDTRHRSMPDVEATDDIDVAEGAKSTRGIPHLAHWTRSAKGVAIRANQ